MSVRESGEMMAQTEMARVLNDTDDRGVVIRGMNSAVRLGFHHTQGRRDGNGKIWGSKQDSGERGRRWSRGWGWCFAGELNLVVVSRFRGSLFRARIGMIGGSSVCGEVLGVGNVSKVSGETKNAWPRSIGVMLAFRRDHAQSFTIRKFDRSMVSPEMCPARAAKVHCFRTQERSLTEGAIAESACRDMFGHSQVSGRGSSESELFDVPFKVVQADHVLSGWEGGMCRCQLRPKLHDERRYGGKRMCGVRSDEIVADGLNRRSQSRPK